MTAITISIEFDVSNNIFTFSSKIFSRIFHAASPDGDPLRVDRRRVGLEVTELLLLLGVQPPLTTSLFWRLVEAAVLVGHTDGLTTCCHSCLDSRLYVLQRELSYAFA